MSTITFARVKEYLNAIASNAAIDISNSPHLAFWNVPYADFISGNVPNVTDSADKPIPIINRASPLESALFVVLTNPDGWDDVRQMPGSGPYITDPGYSVLLGDGTAVTGEQIQDELADWLSSGFPEE